tara:strand:- start:686 stop:1153 length:468 start_codon:yes stop_codon:yes gene_type:complete
MLSGAEIKQFQKLVKKIKKPELQQEVFDSLVEVVPFAACEMVIVNKQNEILLTWREDGIWKGWHFPGGLLRFGDSFEHRLKQVARIELGTKLKSHKFLLPINYKGIGRGHAVSFLFVCQLTGQPKDGKFFKAMPKDIIPDHKLTWKKVRGVLRKK